MDNKVSHVVIVQKVGVIVALVYVRVKEMAAALLQVCDKHDCSLKEGWDKYMHPLATAQFEFEDIVDYIRDNGEEKILKNKLPDVQ